MIPIDFTLLIQAITGIVNPTAMLRNKLERNETVIRLLKQFNLSPDSPPADFSGVYAYTLIEYGVGKPKAVLELFRQPEIRQALQAAWGQDNFSVLLQVGEGFLEGAALGHELRALGIDARQEFYQFATVFIAIAKRTRTPADILTTQQLNSLHRQIAQVQDRLERLPTIEGIRTEMARLTAQSSLALPEGLVSEQCRAFALAQQMRGWFETLDYRFEPYEQWQADSFEWILNIPIRRGRYDRILVRGIEGEAELRDVMALRQSVEAQQADEGWLVTSRRISRAARDEVEKPENRHLDCYTFDELVDLDADFTGYIEWLDAEIKRRKIDTRYVPLGCTKEEIDPDTQQRLGVSRYDERDGWIDGYLDRWLDDPAKEHISVLGEFGTGKTWVAFHYAWTALQRYQEAKERGVQRPRLPLVITLRDYAKALNVENVLAGFFFTQHNIRLNSEVFDQLNRMGKLLLIFDGFDEMAAKVDKQQMINNFWELAKVVVPGAKVILTCRTEHFPDAREGRALLNAQLQASTSNLTGETPQFEVLELEKFNDEQIRQVMSFQASMSTVEQVISNPQLLDLARRPVMTELILEALPEIEAGKPVDMSRVYLYAVRRKMERDIKAERTFTSLADKLYFLCELSWEMLSSDRMSLNYREFPDRIRRLFGSAVQEEKDLDHWHYDMMGQTMLIRNADGDYSPAHRSLLEFFIAYKFAAELGAIAPDFLELLQGEMTSDLEVGNYRWSEYFCPERSRNSRLGTFINESLERLKSGFGKTPLTKAVKDLLTAMIENTDSLLSLLEMTRGRSEEDVNYIGGNAVTLAVEIDKFALTERDLSRTVLIGSDLSSADLRDTNLAQANLAQSIFAKELGAVFSISLSHSGKTLAIGERGGTIRLWNTLSYTENLVVRGHDAQVRSIAFTPDDTLFASGSGDLTIKLWDIRTGEWLRTFQGHSKAVRAIVFSLDQKLLISGSNDSTIKFWNIETGECVKTLVGHTNFVRSLDLSPNGQILASASDDATLRLWWVDSGECYQILKGHSYWVESVVFNPTGQTVVSSSSDSTMKVWNVVTGECVNTWYVPNSISMASQYSNSGEAILITSDLGGNIYFWNICTGVCLKTLRGHRDFVYGLAQSSNGKVLVSGGRDSTIRFWNTQSGECLRTLRGCRRAVQSIIFSIDPNLLISGCNDATIAVWNLQTGQSVKRLKGHTEEIYSIALSRDGKSLASVCAANEIRIWDLSIGECTQVFQGHRTKTREIVFGDDNETVITASYDSTVKLWNVSTGQCLMTYEGHKDGVMAVAVCDHRKMIATCGMDSTVRLWHHRSNQCLKVLQGHTNCVFHVAFNSDGQRLASASHDQTVRLWNVSTGECLNVLSEHKAAILSVAFSPNGDTLASVSSDRTLKLWNSLTGECIASFSGAMDCCKFSLDGSLFAATGVEEGTIVIWDVRSQQCVNVLRTRSSYDNMNITGVVGLTEAEKTMLRALGAVED